MFRFSSLTLPNLTLFSKYYFIPEVYSKNFFRINYAENVKIDEKEICTPIRNTSIIAISKELITSLNCRKDFTFWIVLKVKGKEYYLTEHPLENILTSDTIKHPEYLSTAILTCGEKSIDLGEEILLSSGMIVMPKFTDAQVIDKLNTALNEAFCDAFHTSSFTLESGNPDFSVKVNIGLSADLRERLKAEKVGPFVLPELKAATKVSTSSDLLIKSIIIETASEVEESEEFEECDEH